MHVAPLDPPGMNSRARPVAGIRLVLFLAVAILFACTTRIADPIATSPEMFHEGEYVGSLWHMKAYQSNKASFPLLIHGAMDYTPSQIAHAVYGGSRIIAGTRIVNTWIVVLSWLLFMELVFQMAAPATPARWRAGLPIFLFALLAPPWFSLPVQVTEAFTGVRDIFLLSLILTFLHYWKTSARWSSALAAFGAAILPFAIPWSYDRGIIAVGFTGLMLGGMALHRRWRDLLLSIGSMLLAGILLDRMRIFGTYMENGHNIFYWITQSGVVWGLPFKFTELNSILGVMLIGFCLLVAVLVIREVRKHRAPESLWMLAGLLLIQLLLIKTSLNRPAGARILMALFPSVLLMVHLGTRHFPIRPRLVPPAPAPALTPSPRPLFPVLLSLPIVIFGLILALIHFPAHPLTTACRSFFRTMSQPGSDLRMVPPEVADLGLKLRKMPDPHLFGWCNEGVLQLIARKRWATRFSYAVYAGPSYEEQLLQELKALDPQIIVSRPDAWSMNIDGRPMAERLPAVAKYINTHFILSSTSNSYILYQRQSSPGPQEIAPSLEFNSRTESNGQSDF